MEELKILQEKLLQMFIKFHKICEENKLTYYMIGGTQLGATRHKGFIPWDDDIDVGMPRDDYEKFCLLKDITNDLEIAHYKNKNYFPYGFCKIYDKNTTLVEDVGDGIIGGIFIDVFPLDGIGNSKEEIIKNYKKVALNKRFVDYSFYHIKTENIIKRFINKFILIMDTKKFIEKTNNFLSKFKWKDSTFVINAYGAWAEKEIIKKEYFGTPRLYDFEGHKFYGVENFDLYLKALYGNYMELPPKEKQKSHHRVKYLNMNLPYENYKEEE